MAKYIKKSIYFWPLLLLVAALNAQQTKGLILYEKSIPLGNAKKELPEDIAALLPSGQKQRKVLYFNTGTALYENAEADDSESSNEYQQDNMSIRLEHRVPEEKIFTCWQKNEIVEQRELMGRPFLIDRAMAHYKWKITGRQKKLLDLPCMEAVAPNANGDSIVAWYTPAIPVNAGPEGINGLPGMILELFLSAGIHIAALWVDDLEKGLETRIKKPSKGKHVTEEEFARLTKEKMTEMQKQYGGQGNVIIMKEVR